jgi:hypothetical protein
LGIAVATIFELQDKSIWTKEDVEFYLRVPTLALIPSADLAAGKGKASRKGTAALEHIALRLRAARKTIDG